MALVVWYDEHGWSPITSSACAYASTGLILHSGVKLSRQVDLVYGSDHSKLCLDDGEFDAVVDFLVDRVIKDPCWADSLNEKMMGASVDLLEKTKENAVKVKTASNAELYAFYEDFFNGIAKQFECGLISVLAESKEGALSRKYYEIVKPKIGEGNFAGVADLLAPSALSSPLEQESELIEIASKSSYGMGEKKVANALQDHFNKWQWLSYAFVGPSMSFSDLKKEFDDLVLLKPPIEKAYEMRWRGKKVEEKRVYLMQQFGFTDHEKNLTNAIAGFASTKFKRKENLTRAHYYYHAVLEETSKRIGLAIPEVRLLTGVELRQALVEGKRFDLSGRKKFAAYVYRGKSVEVLEGAEAKKWEEMLKKDALGDERELVGQCACQGSAKGVVKIVNTLADVGKVNQGDVLVSYATYPELVVAMKKASAIVTDRGGVTCHAAVVSRELGIPCVIGTGKATKVLKDGDLVEVDAANGVVKKV